MSESNPFEDTRDWVEVPKHRIIQGDLVRQHTSRGLAYEGYAFYRDDDGDWFTEEGACLTAVGTTFSIIRDTTLSPLPTKPGAQLEVLWDTEGNRVENPRLTVDGFWTGWCNELLLYLDTEVEDIQTIRTLSGSTYTHTDIENDIWEEIL